MNIRVNFAFPALACFVAACSPAQPSSVGGSSSPSIAAPAPQIPSNGALVPNQSQPVTLVVSNAVTTGGTLTYTFEVAFDASFTSKVQTVDGVAAGSSGQTSVTLATLLANNTYYWHARAQGGGTTGVFGPVFKVVIGPAITLSAPSPVSPINGAATGTRPTLTVTNASHTGPTGTIVYRFDVATNASFTAIAASGTAPEGGSQTSFTLNPALPANATFFWRATATDQTNGLTGSASAAATFTTSGPDSVAATIAAQLGVPLWPGIQPPGNSGQATLGDNWDIQTLHHLPSNTFFLSPTIEMLRFFDLFDRGFDPDGAINWMNGNGYPTLAQWYPPPEKAVLGLQYVYLAARFKVTVHGIWDLVLKTE